MAVPIESVASTGDQVISTSTPSRLMGWSAKETAAAVATAVIRDGSDTNGPIVASINLAAAGSTSQWCGPQGVICHNGIFLDRLTGTTAVTVWIE